METHVFMISACENARKVSVRTLPILPDVSPNAPTLTRAVEI